MSLKVGYQKSDVRCQKTEIRSQKSEVRCQKTEIRCQKTDVRGQKSEDRPACPEYPMQEKKHSKDGTAGRCQMSDVKFQESNCLFSVLCPLSSALCILMMVSIAGCVSDRVEDKGIIATYAQSLSDQGPQQRADTEGKDSLHPLDLLRPSPEEIPSDVEIVTDPNTGQEIANLTIEQAIARALRNSPEIRLVSFDPSIARQDITKAAGEFDVTAFGRLNFEAEDNPVNSIFQPGQSDVRVLESGIKQKAIPGSEWSASYALTRSWDDLAFRTLPTRYEPILAFELRQPLLRNAWGEFNLAGVNLAKLNHEIALLGFRQKAEALSTEVISAYWRLMQARHEVEIQQRLLDKTLETLKKVEGRKEIDATDVQIKQTEASAKAREAVLLQARRRVSDAQDVLVRLMADPALIGKTIGADFPQALIGKSKGVTCPLEGQPISAGPISAGLVLNEMEIVPRTAPCMTTEKFESSEVLALAMQKNSVLHQGRVAITIADINILIAENQKMPRLDLIASTRIQGLAKDAGDAHNQMFDGDYASYAVGLSLEYPLGNRQREAELLKRRLERRKAISVLQKIADQVAIQARERIRMVETTHAEIQVQKDTAEAASVHLQALEDSEPIRAGLTPEFLLVKLQAQGALADAQRAEIKAIVDFNISLAELAQTTGTVLELHQVTPALIGKTTEENLTSKD